MSHLSLDKSNYCCSKIKSKILASFELNGRCISQFTITQPKKIKTVFKRRTIFILLLQAEENLSRQFFIYFNLSTLLKLFFSVFVWLCKSIMSIKWISYWTEQVMRFYKRLGLDFIFFLFTDIKLKMRT